jgi:hypothetical protein
MLTNIELQNWLKKFPEDAEIYVLETTVDWYGNKTSTTFVEAELGSNVDHVFRHMPKKTICFGSC